MTCDQTAGPSRPEALLFSSRVSVSGSARRWLTSRGMLLAVVLCAAVLACKEKNHDADAGTGGTTSAGEAPASPRPAAPTVTVPRESASPKPTPPGKSPPPPEPVASPRPAPALSEGPPPRAKDPAAPTKTSYDQEALVALCEEADLPAPPELARFAEDLAGVLREAITKAAKERTAPNLGRLGCLYLVLAVGREDTDRAVSCFEAAKSLAPESAVWPYFLGRVFMIRRSTERARLEFDRALELDADYSKLHAWLGDVELARGVYDEAKKKYERYVELVPDDAQGYAGIAAAELGSGNIAVALQTAQRAVQIEPRCGWAHMVLADAYLKRGQKGDEARAEQERRVAQSMPRSTGAISKDPWALGIWRSLGPTKIAVRKVRAFIAADDEESARMLCEALLADYPDSPQLLTGLATSYLRQQQIDRAVELARRAMELKADHAPAAALLSDCSLALGRPDEALAQASKALEIDEHHAPGYVAKGRALQALRRHDEAVIAFKKASQLLPANRYLLRTVAEALQVQGKLAEAKEYYLKVLQAGEAAEGVAPGSAGVHVSLAEIALREDNKQEAVEHLRRAMDLDPSRERVFRRLAGVLLEMGQPDEALGLCKDLIRKNPRPTGYRILYAELLARVGRAEEAIRYLESLQSRIPDNAAVQHRLGVILLEQNRLAEAKARLRRAIELDATLEDAYLRLSDILSRENDFESGIPLLYIGLDNLPESAMLANVLAWRLATVPDPAYRNPQEAVKWAEKACALTNHSVASLLDTLACAYAAAGRFDEARKAEVDAIEAAASQPGSAPVDGFKARLELFERHEPYYESEQ